MGCTAESRALPTPFCRAVRALPILCLLSVVAAPVAAQDDPLGPIADLVRRHADVEASSALAALPARERRRPRTRYLRARLLERAGRLREAADLFPTGADAGALPATVRRDSTRRAAAAYARSGRCERARELVGDQRADPMVEARLAECALAEGDLEGAVDELRAVVRRGDGAVDLFAARFALAEALTRSGETDDAVEILTELIVTRVAHPEVVRARAALLALNGEPVELGFTRRALQAGRLIEVRRHSEALALLEDMGRPRSRAERRRWLHLYGTALYRERHHYAPAAEILAESASMNGAHAADDQFLAARALSRADRDEEAVRAYRRFVRERSTHRRAPEASYLAAWLELRHGMRGGERNMARFARSALARRAPRFQQEATWQLGLRAFERGRHRAAERHLVRYAAMSPSPMVRARGRYWIGRARQARGDDAGAIASYRDALYVEPLHWYALLARQRLEELGEDAPSPFPQPPLSGVPRAVRVELPEDVRFYARLGLRTDALARLRARETRMRRGPGGLRRVVAAYQQLGEASRVARMLGGPSTLRRRNAPGPMDRWRWAAAYPRPWPEHAAESASPAGLSAAHIYAVMRQESGFDPDVVSHADAIGLMQLLPETALRMAARIGLDLRREMLFDPEINIRVGAAYVGGLVSRFGVPLAFAGFNAGGHRVDSWLQRSGRIELDLFVEHIPFEQTRNYIRRVTTHLAHYRYLEDPERGWPLTLPTHVEPR